MTDVCWQVSVSFWGSLKQAHSPMAKLPFQFLYCFFGGFCLWFLVLLSVIISTILLLLVFLVFLSGIALAHGLSHNSLSQNLKDSFIKLKPGFHIKSSPSFPEAWTLAWGFWFELAKIRAKTLVNTKAFVNPVSTEWDVNLAWLCNHLLSFLWATLCLFQINLCVPTSVFLCMWPC